MRAGMPEWRERRAGRLNAHTFGKVEIDHEKAIAVMRGPAMTAGRQRHARTPDRVNPLQRLTAFVVITEQKNDDAASREANI